MDGYRNEEGACRWAALLADDSAVSQSLKDIAALRGYVERGDDSQTWLEWHDGLISQLTDPHLTEAFLRLNPFEPFEYPTFSKAEPVVNIPKPTFLWGRPYAFQVVRAHTRQLAGQISFDDERRVAPNMLGWLISYRDALALDLRRRADRLEASPYGAGSRGAPLTGALAVIKVWLAEAVLTSKNSGTTSPGFLAHVAFTVWESFKRGAEWGGNDWLASSMWYVEHLDAHGSDRAVVVSVLRGISHYARARDLITDPAHDIWARLLAAEIVLDAGLRGIPMNEAWIEAVVRQQQEDKERRDQKQVDARAQDATRARLRKTLLDPQLRLTYIMGTFHPTASASTEKGSVWAATHALYVEAWEDAGLPDASRPYPTHVALKDAVTAARRRGKKRGE